MHLLNTTKDFCRYIFSFSFTMPRFSECIINSMLWMELYRCHLTQRNASMRESGWIDGFVWFEIQKFKPFSEHTTQTGRGVTGTDLHIDNVILNGVYGMFTLFNVKHMDPLSVHF